MDSNYFEAEARFIPQPRTRPNLYWPRCVLMLLVLGGYIAIAALQDGPFHVWLIAMAPLALIALELALRITEESMPDE